MYYDNILFDELDPLREIIIYKLEKDLYTLTCRWWFAQYRTDQNLSEFVLDITGYVLIHPVRINDVSIGINNVYAIIHQFFFNDFKFIYDPSEYFER